jgi:hypothetical protein
LIDKARASRVVAQAMSRVRLHTAIHIQRGENPNTKWIAMPGNRLELACTGWQIVIERRNVIFQGQRTVYIGLNPEGDEVAASITDLQQVKQAVERMAADRQEFQL